MELNKGKTTTIQNANRDNDEKVIVVNVESKSGNKLVEIESI